MDKGCNCASYTCDCWKPTSPPTKNGLLLSYLKTALLTDNPKHAKHCIESAIQLIENEDLK